MSTYIPPHLRFTGRSMDIRNEPRSLQSLAGGSPYADVPSYTDRDIVAHFWRDDDSEDKMRSSSNTLNASKDNQDQLAFMLIYAAGHPKWEEEGIVYVKSALHLLPGFNEKLAERRAEMKKQAADDAVELGEESSADDGGSADAGESTADASQGLETTMADHNITDDDETDGTIQERMVIVTDEALTEPGAAQAIDETAGAGESQGTDKADEIAISKQNVFEDTETQTTNSIGSETQETQTTDGIGVKSQEMQKTNDTGKKKHGQQLLQQIPPIDYAPAAHPPIAVFKTNGHSHHGFKFVGWHKIERTAILLRKSTALGDLMRRKWDEVPGRRFRGASRPKQSWLSDLSREWAVIKLVKLDPASEECPPSPVVTKIETRRNREHLPMDDGPIEEASGHGGEDGPVEEPETVGEAPATEVETDDD